MLRPKENIFLGIRAWRLNYAHNILLIREEVFSAERSAIHRTGAMSFEQFTQYDVELEVPEEAVQNLDENVRKSMAPLSLAELPPANAA